MRNQTAENWLDCAVEIIKISNRAPSLHNTQPWRWKIDSEGAYLNTDQARWLPAADPDRHGLILSCGAALRLAEIAARSLGFVTSATWRPRGDAGPLARLDIVGKATPSPHDLQLVAAARRRVSDRRPLDGSMVTSSVIDALQRGVTGEISFTRLGQPERLMRVAMLAEAAEAAEWGSRAYREELRQWTHTGNYYSDGVPLSAMVDHPSVFPQRDFGIYPQESSSKKDSPAVLAIGTVGDSERFWLDAGGAMIQIMLNAQLEGLATCPITQPVDLPSFRARLGLYLGGVDTPQFLLRMGVPLDTAHEPHRIPRLPVSEVID